MNKKSIIANLIFPNINETINDLEKKYPPRDLPNGAIVTRFAPSPTGFLHTGSLFTSLVSYRFAKQTQGVFFMRLEDTDQKREIKGSGEKVLEQLLIFGINRTRVICIRENMAHTSNRNEKTTMISSLKKCF